MIELRLADVGDGKLQLQQRTRIPRVDANGAFCDFTEWSDWSAVPIVRGEWYGRPVVDHTWDGVNPDDASGSGVVD